MQRLVKIAMLTAILELACSEERVAPPPAPPVNWNPPRMSLAQRTGPVSATAMEHAVEAAYMKALSEPSFDQLGRLFDEDAHFAFTSTSDAHGRSRIVAAHDALFGAFDQRKFTTSRVWFTDSSQVLEWTMTGVQARNWMGISAANKPVAIKGLSLIWTKDDGSITDVHIYFDVAVVKAQLGVGVESLLGLPLPQLSAGARQDCEQTGGPEETANVARVHTLLDALENNMSAYLAAMSDDVEVSTLERSQPARGKEDARAYYKAMHKAVGELDTSIRNAWGIGPFVIAEYFIMGEQRGSLGWIPVQHDTVLKLTVVDVMEMRERKIARVWRYDNPSEILMKSPIQSGFPDKPLKNDR